MNDLTQKTKAELIEELKLLRAQVQQKNGDQEIGLEIDEDELIEMSPDKDGEELFLVTEVGKIVFVNDALVENLGYARNELVDQPLAKLDKNTPRGKWLSYVMSMKNSNKPLRFEAAHIGRDGGVWKKEVTAKFLTYHGKKYVLCSAKLMSLAASSEPSSVAVSREATLMNLVTEGLMVVDTRGIIEDTNLALDRLLGAPKSDLLGRSCVDPKWHITDVRGNAVKISDHPVTVALVEETTVQDVRLVMNMPDGSLRLLTVNASPLYDEEGKLCGAVASIRTTDSDKATPTDSKSAGTLVMAHRQLTQTIVNAESTHQLERRVCEALVDAGNYPLVWIGQVRPGDYRVRPGSMAGEKAEFLLKIKVRYDESSFSKGPIGRSIKLKEMQVCADTQADPTYLPWKKQAARMNLHSFVSIPLLSDGEVFGMLAVYSEERNHFLEGEMALLKEISEVAAFGINQIRNAELRREAVSESVQQRQLIEALIASYRDSFCLFDAKKPFESLRFNDAYQAMLDEPYKSQGIDKLFLSEYQHSHLHRDLFAALEEVSSTAETMERIGDTFMLWDGTDSHWDWSIIPIRSNGTVMQLFYTARPSDAPEV